MELRHTRLRYGNLDAKFLTAIFSVSLLISAIYFLCIFAVLKNRSKFKLAIELRAFLCGPNINYG